MSKKRSRTGSKPEATNMPNTFLPAKANVFKCPNNGISTDRLAGIEDIAQCDSSGVPFILVDGVCVKSRQQLQAALSKREKKNMKRIQKKCCVLPWLDHTSPATDTVPITESEKDAKEESDFLADMQQLQLDMLRAEGKPVASLATGSITPIAHATSVEDLVPHMSRMDEIRIQLEKLREQQQCDPIIATPLAEQQRIRRQATFDIERDAPIETSVSSISLDFQTPIFSQQRLIRATTSSQLPTIDTRRTLQRMNSATCLCKKSTSSMVLGSNKSCRLEPFNTLRSPVSPIVNQIGDLLMQLPHQQQENISRNTGPFSYVVTISPKVGGTSCNVEPLPVTKTRSLTIPNASRCVTETIKRDSPIDIGAAPSSLQPKSRTFLKMPRLFKKIKK
ncbi:uncharacterized protein [Drosophila virilis]|uniref:Uncharacterized protein n=1 Tax=Drosophila virilis TaxID=7244 RepID=B4M0S1_DROVI|nr:uncharacterized protein LOC6629553 [Drosophila virilis]EDW67363.1 uncharacterized protein Dvir_GJ23120 [Drosophila virilis]